MKLAIRIIDNERGGFIAICPALPGCRSQGSTREEARRKIDEAVRGYLAAMGNFVPETLSQDLVEA